MILYRRSMGPLQNPSTQYGGKKTAQTACNGCEYRFLMNAFLLGHSAPRSRGSLISRIQSPTKLMDRLTRKIATPGIIVSHQAV